MIVRDLHAADVSTRRVLVAIAVLAAVLLAVVWWCAPSPTRRTSELVVRIQPIQECPMPCAAPAVPRLQPADESRLVAGPMLACRCGRAIPEGTARWLPGHHGLIPPVVCQQCAHEALAAGGAT